MQEVIQISSFDGQTIWLNFKTELFDVGNFLGGGAAGNVYECEHIQSKGRFAIKVLNPLGFKITTSQLLRKFLIVSRGESFADHDKEAVISLKHVWWLMNSATKQYLACYCADKGATLKELSLSHCMTIWGTNIPIEQDYDVRANDFNRNLGLNTTPIYPPKYVEFLRKRDRIFREIRNMRKISSHPNVIRLEAVLELTQDSKCTIFLVMELANGGELFDRIKTDCGTCEDTAKYFFWQLLQGVQHCHMQGVCHRDLKPENLLLQGEGKEAVLKIADFGFSAHLGDYQPRDIQSSTASPSSFSGGEFMSSNQGLTRTSYPQASPASSFPEESPLRVLKSVVGSPFYVAPEVLQASGYDGQKADMWSMGVILYAMLAGNLPFGHELATCKRFRQFCKWVREMTGKGVRFWDDSTIEYPTWLFPARFSPAAKGLIVAMLHPDPPHRITVLEAMKHPLCLGQQDAQHKMYQGLYQQMIHSRPSIFTPYMSKAVTSAKTIPLPLPSFAEIESKEVGISAMALEDHTERLISRQSSEPSQGKAHSMNSKVSSNDDIRMAVDEEGEEEVFKMEEDDQDERAPTNRVNTNSATSDPGIAAIDRSNSDFIATPERHFRVIKNEATTSSSYGRSRATPPTLPLVPPSYLTQPGLDDLLNENAKGEMVEMDSPLGPRTNQSVASNPSIGSNPHSSNLLSSSTLSLAISNNSSHSGTAAPVPAFIDRVKRSTRFLTIVPVAVLLEQVERILDEVCKAHIETPAGYIGRVAVDWDRYRLEVWNSSELSGPAIFAMQLYQMPPGSSHLAASFSYTTYSIPCSPDRGGSLLAQSLTRQNYMSPSVSASPGGWFGTPSQSSMQPPPPPQELYLVEFIRGQLEIFAFKRFYQYIRQRLAEFVKRDYAYKQFDPAVSSPMMESYMMQHMQRHQMS